MVLSKKEPQKGLTFSVILFAGVILSVLSLITFLLVRRILVKAAEPEEHAVKLYHQGHYDAALQTLAGVSYDSGVYLLEAKIWLAKALEQQDIHNWKDYGTTRSDWFTGDDIQNAVAAIDRAIQDDPKNAEAFYIKGAIYKEKGWFTDAEGELRDAIRLDKNHVGARLMLASLLTQTQRYTEAEDQLLKAHAIAPDNPSVAKNLGFLYRFFIQKPESAKAWLEKYVALAPGPGIDIHTAKVELEELRARYPEVANP
jgi:tetratricopeptide (TPR) repeat protein